MITKTGKITDRLFIILLTLTSACGISTPHGYVMGTTDYLRTFNAGAANAARPKLLEANNLEQHQEQDREALSSLITRGGRTQ